MRRYVFDADAWIFGRRLSSGGLSLLSAAVEHEHTSPIFLTGYVCTRELANAGPHLERYIQQKKVVVHEIEQRDPEFKRLKQAGVDKGEAEIIAYLLGLRKRQRPLYVVRDGAATRAARAEKLDVTDLLGLAVDLVNWGAIPSEEKAQEILSVWDDKSQELGRPRDWDGFANSFARRRAKGFPFGPP